MLILGIESTAHTFGVAIVDAKKRKVLLNVKDQFQNDVGMDPRKLSDYHVQNFDKVLIKASVFLKKENKSFKDLDLISFSQGPGIGNALKIGALVAKTIAKKYDVPIVGVNHIKAHLEIGKMFTGFKDPIFLYVSGVNTQVIAMDEFNNGYKVYGETEDIGLGNLFDSCARLFGFGFPGGPIIEKTALKSSKYLEIPYTVKGMNSSFAGIYSYIKQCIEKFEEGKPINKNENESIKYENRDELIADLCYSLQETVYAMAMEIIERAIAYTKKKEFIIVGGVAASRRVTQMAEEMAFLREIKYDSFPMEFCLDNAAMIAWTGFVDLNRASKSIGNLKPLPYITIESEI